MKKSLIIITLMLLQCACATQEPVQDSSTSLLSIEAIGAEITVTYESTEDADDLSRTVAMNDEK